MVSCREFLKKPGKISRSDRNQGSQFVQSQRFPVMIVDVCSQCVETVIVTVIISGSSRFSGRWEGSTEKIDQLINET